MSQRKLSLLRASVLVLTIAVALFGVVPRHAAAQADQPTALTPASTAEVPALPAQPVPLFVLPVAVPTVPPAPTALPHPGNRDHAQARINGQNFNAADGPEDLRAPRPQQNAQQAIGRKQQKPGRQQWIMGERLRVANEAARREADRMINAASPMDWRNRYSAD